MIQNLGRYEVVEEIGRGAMGVVYKAKDPLIDRMVAIKTINLQNLAKDERTEYEARFYQEARAAGRLNHPNIVTIHDLGENDGIAYIAMELMQGSELQNLLEDGKSLPLEDALSIAIQVAAGLAYAHEHGIIHRDVKPSNIMVLEGGQAKIADFGIARMDTSLLSTQTGKVLGSPLYMSPEQVRSHNVDTRSDIFSLGILLFRMLTGQFPFSGENAHAVMYQIVNEAPRTPSSLSPDIPQALDAIIFKCLAKKPEDRYQNARELEEALRACSDSLRIRADLEQSGALSDISSGRTKKLKLIAFAVVLFIVFELIEKFFFNS
ncbi:MAG: serine/threonine protein kinase [Nitrosomonadales bacterium]|nr:serine/threonine protein kinase [Nitrosomonadales bacterium]